jgi:hypothetical protein
MEHAFLKLNRNERLKCLITIADGKYKASYPYPFGEG